MKKRKWVIFALIIPVALCIWFPICMIDAANKKFEKMGMKSSIDSFTIGLDGPVFRGVKAESINPDSKIRSFSVSALTVGIFQKTIRVEKGSIEINLDSKTEESDVEKRQSGWVVEANSMRVSAHHHLCTSIDAKSVNKRKDQIEVGYLEAQCFGSNIVVSNIMADSESVNAGYTKIEVQERDKILSLLRPKEKTVHSGGSSKRRTIGFGQVELMDSESNTRMVLEKVNVSDSVSVSHVNIHNPRYKISVHSNDFVLTKSELWYKLISGNTTVQTDMVGYEPVQISHTMIDINKKEQNIKAEADGIKFEIGWIWGDSGVGMNLTIEPTKCNDIMNLIPSGEYFHQIKMDGEISASVAISSTFRENKKRTANADVKISNKCSFISGPIQVQNVLNQKSFQSDVIMPNGEFKTMDFGTQSPLWVPYRKISKYMTMAVLETEDAGFFSHKGISTQAISEALKEDIENGRFRRGGSTISMQLAKNIWLNRDKTISRKAQEFFLTSILEQSMTKQQILENYFNVIEYGPGLYGIRSASERLFDTSPASLTMTQSIALALLLPNPKAKIVENGQISDRYKPRVKRILNRMLSKDKITGLEYEMFTQELDDSEQHPWVASDD